MADDKKASALEIKKFFGIDSTADFAKEWKELSDKDKEQIRTGIGNDTNTY